MSNNPNADPNGDGDPGGGRGPPPGRGPPEGRGWRSDEHPVFVDGQRFPGRAGRDFLRDKKNVIGHGIGFQEQDGNVTDEKGVVVYVEKKEPDSDLSEDERVPEEISGTPTDVIEAPFTNDAHQSVGNRYEEYRPVLGGVRYEAVHQSVTDSSGGGTFAGWFYDVDDGEPVGLSAKHVLYPNSDDDPSVETGSDVYQPTQTDGSSFGQIKQASDPSNGAITDCGYISLPTGDDPTTRAIGQGEIVDIHSPKLDEYYTRNGRRSGLIGGRCIAIDVVRIRPNEPDQPGAFVYDAEGAGGDSGALVGHTDTNGDVHAVGLHIASHGNRGVCSSFDQIAADPALNTIEPLTDHMPNYDTHPTITSAFSDQSYIETGVRHVDYDPAADELTVELFTANTGNQSGSTTYDVINTDTGNTVFSDSVSLNSAAWTIDTFTLPGSAAETFHGFRTTDMNTAYSNDDGISAVHTNQVPRPGSEPHVVAHTTTGTLTDQNFAGIDGATVVAVRDGQRISVTETASDGSFSLDFDDTDPAHVFFDTDLSNYTNPRVTWSYPDRDGSGGGS